MKKVFYTKAITQLAYSEELWQIKLSYVFNYPTDADYFESYLKKTFLRKKITAIATKYEVTCRDSLQRDNFTIYTTLRSQLMHTRRCLIYYNNLRLHSTILETK